jgi:DNA-binding transcriptional LysR family regulator
MAPIKERDMRRNLDLTALRALVTVADYGGVTRAAQALNLTQSAVSMQLKRLETVLGLALLDRGGRGVQLSDAGEQMVGYARRMLALNDEAVARLTGTDYEGEIVLCVPYDIVHPVVPRVLQQFAAAFPRMKVQLQAVNTRDAREALARGACDLILTTEERCDPGGETLTELQLVWYGAKGGQAWRRRPLRLALGRICSFRPGVLAALDRAGVAWEAAVESDSDRTLEAAVSCDMAIYPLLDGTAPAFVDRIAHGGALPDLSRYRINLYAKPGAGGPGVTALADLFREAWVPGEPETGARPALVAV